MAKTMTPAEMEQAYPAMCQKCEDLQSDLDATRESIKRLKEDKKMLERNVQDAEMRIMELKAKLYDMTAGTYL